MMDMSVFTDKQVQPDDAMLADKLAAQYGVWHELKAYVQVKVPAVLEEWNYPGPKFGWSYRLKDKKRAIIYLLPRDGYFKVSMVFGKKAVDQVMVSSVNETIKRELATARVYAEGRGIRLNMREVSLSDIKVLVDIKMGN